GGIPGITLAKVLNADHSNDAEWQQLVRRHPGLLPYLANRSLAGRFTIVPTAGDALPEAVVGASEDGVFEMSAGISPIQQHENLKWCARHHHYLRPRRRRRSPSRRYLRAITAAVR